MVAKVLLRILLGPAVLVLKLLILFLSFALAVSSIESLRIISDEEMQFAQYTQSRRMTRKSLQPAQQEEDAQEEDAPTKASMYGATLLSGLLYCAHCGHRLIGGYCTKQRANHTYRRPIYRCYTYLLSSRRPLPQICGITSSSSS